MEASGEVFGSDVESLVVNVDEVDGEDERVDPETEEDALGGKEVVRPRSDPPMEGVRYPPLRSSPESD